MRLQGFVFEDSRYIDSKPYAVYLPASYDESPEKEYAVLYMMDRQNLFIDSLAYGGVSWRIDKVVDSLSKLGSIQELIIVGIDHANEKRFSEYVPQKPLESLPAAYLDSLRSLGQHSPYADEYLSFLVQELKPHIDEVFRTKKDAAHTFIGGSSMGGLISMYALCEYPAVFGGAMCLSTHWPVSLDNTTPEVTTAIVNYMSENLPLDKKWYFDHGTEGLDRFYEPYQLQVDSVLMAKGYQHGENWLSQKFEGHDHNERDWNARASIPLEFVIGK